jgi:hypothetical protein
MDVSSERTRKSRPLTSERDQYARGVAQLAIAGPLARTTEISDPPKLSDGKDPAFEDWLLLIEQKLSANAVPL